jgi:beta-lactamase class A
MVLLLAATLLAADFGKPETVAQLARIANSAAGRVGAAATVLEGGKVFEFHATEHFPMQSVYKLPIGMAVLSEVDRGRLKLDSKIHVDPKEYISTGQHSPLRDANPQGADVTVAELLRLAVSESDGTASDVLLRIVGGAPVIMNYLKGLGVTEMIVRDTEMKLGRDSALQYENWATPRGAIDLLRAVQESRTLSVVSRRFLIEQMTGTATFPGRLKGLLPPGTPVAHKTGSSGTQNGVSAATNDIGIITLPDQRHLAIAVFVSDAKAGDAARDRVIAAIARLAWDLAVQPKP